MNASPTPSRRGCSSRAARAWALTQAARVGVRDVLRAAAAVGTPRSAKRLTQQRRSTRARALVHAVERRQLAAREQLGHLLVGEDHQLLDQRVRPRLARRGARHDAAVLDLEGQLVRLDRRARRGEAPAPQLGRDPLGEPQRLDHGGAARRGAPSRISCASCSRAERPSGSASGRSAARRARSAASKRHLDRHRAPIAVLLQRARPVRELVRQHRLDPARARTPRTRAGEASRSSAAPGRTWKATSAMWTHRRQPVALAHDRDRVVEVARVRRVDRHAVELAQVDALLVEPVGLDGRPRCASAERVARGRECRRRSRSAGRACSASMSSGRPSRSIDPAAARAAARRRRARPARPASEPRRAEPDRRARLEERLGDEEACRGARPRRPRARPGVGQREVLSGRAGSRARRAARARALLGRRVDRRQHAAAVQVAALRRAVLGDRELERRAVRERLDRLQRALAERARTDDRAAHVIADGGRDDLGGARRAAIDQHRERHRRQRRVRRVRR